MLLRLFTGPFGTIAFYGIVILFCVAGFFGWLAMHDSAIETQKSLQLQLDQSKQILEDQAKYQKSLDDLGVILKDTRDKMDQTFTKLDESEDRIKQTIKSIKDFNDQAPDSVKETLRQLRGTK